LGKTDFTDLDNYLIGLFNTRKAKNKIRGVGEKVETEEDLNAAQTELTEYFEKTSLADMKKKVARKEGKYKLTQRLVEDYKKTPSRRKFKAFWERYEHISKTLTGEKDVKEVYGAPIVKNLLEKYDKGEDWTRAMPGVKDLQKQLGDRVENTSKLSDLESSEKKFTRAMETRRKVEIDKVVKRLEREGRPVAEVQTAKTYLNNWYDQLVKSGKEGIKSEKTKNQAEIGKIVNKLVTKDAKRHNLKDLESLQKTFRENVRIAAPKRKDLDKRYKTYLNSDPRLVDSPILKKKFIEQQKKESTFKSPFRSLKELVSETVASVDSKKKTVTLLQMTKKERADKVKKAKLALAQAVNDSQTTPSEFNKIMKTVKDNHLVPGGGKDNYNQFVDRFVAKQERKGSKYYSGKDGLKKIELLKKPTTKEAKGRALPRKLITDVKSQPKPIKRILEAYNGSWTKWEKKNQENKLAKKAPLPRPDFDKVAKALGFQTDIKKTEKSNTKQWERYAATVNYEAKKIQDDIKANLSKLKEDIPSKERTRAVKENKFLADQLIGLAKNMDVIRDEVEKKNGFLNPANNRSMTLKNTINLHVPKQARIKETSIEKALKLSLPPELRPEALPFNAGNPNLIEEAAQRIRKPTLLKAGIPGDQADNITDRLKNLGRAKKVLEEKESTLTGMEMLKNILNTDIKTAKGTNKYAKMLELKEINATLKTAFEPEWKTRAMTEIKFITETDRQLKNSIRSTLNSLEDAKVISSKEKGRKLLELK
jgi:hypothetical protein